MVLTDEELSRMMNVFRKETAREILSAITDALNKTLSMKYTIKQLAEKYVVEVEE